MTED
jgi:hypothetical protein